MGKLSGAFSGDALKARFVRSSSWRVINFGATQFLRLASNLLLTRLLFPEAFGQMALVTVFLTGLSMFSDTGIITAIQQNERGDEPEFLDTAWAIQILRGIVLWGVTWPLGMAIAAFYNEPLLASLLPIAGLTLLIDGFKPTRFYTAQRHLQVGRLTAVQIAGAVTAIIITATLAWWLRSVWALVWGMAFNRLLVLGMFYVFLEGRRDRFAIEKRAASDMLHFGKWIFVSTICGFLNNQGDRLILGKYLSLDLLGIYNVGFFLASMPMLLGNAVFNQVLVPYLREKHPSASPQNFRAFRRVRLFTSGGLLGLVILLALIGPALVTLLYDSRYHSAGSVLIFICFASIPLLVAQGYGRVSLAAGDSRGYAWAMIVGAVLNTGLFLVGADYGGLPTALLGLGIGRILHYPVMARLAHRHGAWDPLLDVGLTGLGVLGALIALAVHPQALSELQGF